MNDNTMKVDFQAAYVIAPKIYGKFSPKSGEICVGSFFFFISIYLK